MAQLIRSAASGKKIVFGVVAPKPILNAPEGKQRLRMRSKDAVYLFVKNAAGIRKFVVHDLGTHWETAWEVGRNYRP